LTSSLRLEGKTNPAKAPAAPETIRCALYGSMVTPTAR